MMDQDTLLAQLDLADTRIRALLGDLSDEQLAVPYLPGINPPIWEMGHAAFFYEYFLLRPLYNSGPIMPGYDGVWDSFDIPHKERWTPGIVPPRRDTLAYYDHVIAEARHHLASPQGLSPRELYLGQYVIAHQCMHLESLLWARQSLAYPPPSFIGELAPPPSELAPTGTSGDASIPGGSYTIGIPAAPEPHLAPQFSFDNERPGFQLELAPFQISKTLVSNADFLTFVEDEGYSREDLWSFGGRFWLRQARRAHPLYWHHQDDRWLVRRFDSLLPLDPAAPALHLSFWEAEAYCTWAGRRLPTEFEWEAAARGPDATLFPWGNTLSPGDAPPPADLDAALLGTAPVDALPSGVSPTGCLQMVGTAWEWTTSQYLPFDGFSVDMYAYMSTLQFGDHKTARGGSGATSASLIRSTYRQAYHPHRADIFTAFRTCPL
jgi:gamma-glutamyl hercynylcysteine S-oxide synthase